MRKFNPSLLMLDELQDSALYDVYARRGLHGEQCGVVFKDGEAKHMPGVVVKKLRGQVNVAVFPPGTPVEWLPGGGAVMEQTGVARAMAALGPDLKTMSARQLKEVAADRGIKGYGGMRKAQLLAILGAGE